MYGGPSSPDSGHDSEDEEFIYPGASETSTTNHYDSSEGASPIAPPAQPNPSPAQLESSYAAAASGSLELLKKIFVTASQTGDVEAFSLANDASSRTGFTALHAAASRGYLDIVKWREWP